MVRQMIFKRHLLGDSSFFWKLCICFRFGLPIILEFFFLSIPHTILEEVCKESTRCFQSTDFRTWGLGFAQEPNTEELIFWIRLRFCRIPDRKTLLLPFDKPITPSLSNLISGISVTQVFGSMIAGLEKSNVPLFVARFISPYSRGESRLFKRNRATSGYRGGDYSLTECRLPSLEPRKL